MLFRLRRPHLAAPTVSAAATIVSAAAGTVSFTFTAAQTATPGLFYSEWVVTFSAGVVTTSDNDGHDTVEIVENLAAQA